MAPSPSVKTIVSTNVPTAAPIETVPVQVIRHLPPPATVEPTAAQHLDAKPLPVHVVSVPVESAPVPAATDQYKALAKMVVNQAVGSVEKELKDGIKQREQVDRSCFCCHGRSELQPRPMARVPTQTRWQPPIATRQGIAAFSLCSTAECVNAAKHRHSGRCNFLS